MIWIGIVFIFVGTIINCNVSDEHPGVYFGTILACVGYMLTAAACYEKKAFSNGCLSRQNHT